MNGTGTAVRGHRDNIGSRMGMWLFLLTEISFFFGPVLLYAVFRYRFPEEFMAASKELDLAVGTVNTAVLITSSLFAAVAVSAMKKGRKNLTAALLTLTVVLGAVFIYNKYIEWDAKILHGIYPNSGTLLAGEHGRTLFFGLYFFLTGLHGLHVIAGMALLSAVAVMVLRGSVNQGDHIKLENSALYWHLVDVVWIYLFPFFYLIT